MTPERPPPASEPRVEMLWEDDDSSRALLERFGFADAVSAGRWVAETLATYWRVDVETCERIVISSSNALAWVTARGEEPLLAKWSVVPRLFSRLREVARLTPWLDERRQPVSCPVPTTSGEAQVELDQVSMCVQRVVSGELLDVERPEQVRAAGAVLARLHAELATYPRTAFVVERTGPPRPLSDRVLAWLDTSADHVPQASRRSMRELIGDASSDLPPAQLVHGDYRSSNVLCAGSGVAAVLDFEEARLDHCVVELARSAVMLGTRFRDWGPVSRDVRATFLAGYESVCPLTATEAAWWEVLLRWHAWAMVPPGDDPTGWRASALDLERDSVG